MTPASESQVEAKPLSQPRVEPCADRPLTARLEALLFSTDRPLSESRITELLGIPGKGSSKTISGAIEELNSAYEASGRTFRAQRLAGGWQLMTAPDFGPLLSRLHEQREHSKLSQPALETLAIIAYRQPILRAEVEAIRGVACGDLLRSLMERRLVKITGRAEEIGRPMLYGTTSEFLKTFGLASLDDLPEVKGLAGTSTRKQAPAKAAVAEASAVTDEPSQATVSNDAEDAGHGDEGDEP